MFRLFSRADPDREAGRTLFREIARQARREIFHIRFKVPDTIDGRFDLLTLHGFLALEALKNQGRHGARVGTHLATAIFESLDEALRELGVGDMGISRRIKAMADAFYGRLAAYSAAGDRSAMTATLIRNLYRGVEERRPEAELLADYVLESLAQGRIVRTGESAGGGEIMFASLPGETGP